ncbi:MAG: hypothetical protein CMP11_03300 [Zetaproteobacteria bacterium]|nr:hypothetical protein [Pseudobdellovibrionaceae bacterium]
MKHIILFIFLASCSDKEGENSESLATTEELDRVITEEQQQDQNQEQEQKEEKDDDDDENKNEGEDDDEPRVEILGCTNKKACNYNKNAQSDNGSCIFSNVYRDCKNICTLDIDNDNICDDIDKNISERTRPESFPPPIINMPDSFSISENQSLILSIQAEIYSNKNITYNGEIVSGSGNILINKDQIIVTPSQNFYGTLTIKISIDDGYDINENYRNNIKFINISVEPDKKNIDDLDEDGDGVKNEDDLEPYNSFACSDSENNGQGDTCDDCSLGVFDPSNDGLDSDNDGLCDDGDYYIVLNSSIQLVSFWQLPEDRSTENIISKENLSSGEIFSIFGENKVLSSFQNREDENARFIGNLKTIEPLRGYYISSSDYEKNVKFHLKGKPVADQLASFNEAEQSWNYDFEIDLRKGYNLIGYPYTKTLPVGEFFSLNQSNNIEAIIGEKSIATPDGSGSLKKLEINKGYWILLTDNAQIQFSPPAKKRNTEAHPEDKTPTNLKFNTSMKFSFFIIEDITNDSSPFSEDDWIVSFRGNTVTGARQLGDLNIDLPAMGDDSHLWSKNYFQEGEKVNFKIYRSNTNEYQDLKVLKGDPTWSQGKISKITLSTY